MTKKQEQKSLLAAIVENVSVAGRKAHGSHRWPLERPKDPSRPGWNSVVTVRTTKG